MNIQASKVVLIEEILRMNDERLITRFESFIREEKKTAHERNLKAMSIDEFHEMIDQARQNSNDGRVISHQDLKKKVKTWK
ncbi:MAG TPA: hypothetical protein VFC67_06265 [Prolixibacteraceae bacterium]|nr:hypothetical protein [Prolixibacteraceae bacterium]